jgi:hypothetical protein
MSSVFFVLLDPQRKLPRSRKKIAGSDAYGSLVSTKKSRWIHQCDVEFECGDLGYGMGALSGK